jgi:DNA repair protein RecN (Recombination protein N)
MLTLLSISNIALIAELRVEFDRGLNLLTGETGSGKSIIVDALGVLIGGRFTSDLIKSGSQRAFIEGLFSVAPNRQLEQLLATAGIDPGGSEMTGAEPNGPHELIIRRELSVTGRNKIFVNNQLATQALLRELRPFLVDIHGQGDQQTLFDTDTHLEMLDAFAGVADLRREVADSFRQWRQLDRELAQLQQGEAEKLQLTDILKFQIDELERAQLAPGEDETLADERRRLQNVEKLTLLCTQSYGLIYEDNEAALTRLRQATKHVAELSGYESSFKNYLEGLESARALLEDLAFALRDFSARLEFSPERQEQIENRLAELSGIKRKFGGSIESALAHLAHAADRLRLLEHGSEREAEVQAGQAAALAAYLERARRLHRERVRAAKKFEQKVERGLAAVAMESAKFQVKVTAPDALELKESGAAASFGSRGIDQVEFCFSANPGEAVKPLVKVASGGEASRLMLVLKTVANASEFPRTIVFDEIDSGIGGRVSEAVGAKLKHLAVTNQVLCVTHQPQIARFADNHLLVRKEPLDGHTEVQVAILDRRARVEEIARMLTGAEITDSARRHARELLKSSPPTLAGNAT